MLIILPLFTEWKLAGFFPLGGEIDDRSQECLWFIYKVCTQNLVSLNAAETNNRHFPYSEFPSWSLWCSVYSIEPCCSSLGSWQGSASLAVLLKGTEGRHAHEHAHPSPLLPTSNQASSPLHAMGILAKLSPLLAELCHHPGRIFGCLQPPAPEGAGMLFSCNWRDRHVEQLSGGV